jgi:phosphoribosylaminoimidazole-succinocarboxamide synthase
VVHIHEKMPIKTRRRKICNIRHIVRKTAKLNSPTGRSRSGLAPSPVTRLTSPRRHSMPDDTLVSLDLPGVQKLRSGKVREVFDLGETILFVATDRLSAFDVILPDPIPDKGAVLNQISAFWFEKITKAQNHFLTADFARFPEQLQPYRAQLAGRSMLVRKTQPLLIECVVRGYLAGSGWKDYQATGEVCGHALPPGLQLASELPEPLFTPSTKAPIGEHDENISLADVVTTVGADAAAELERLTLAAYGRAEEIARGRGIILADTKFEFGRRPAGESGQLGPIVLADEVLTPDSSRFWPADEYEPGRAQPSFDKQYVRDWLTSPASGWDRASDTPPPALPDDVVAKTREKYIEAYERLTGLSWS